MTVTYKNFYKDSAGAHWANPRDAMVFSSLEKDFVRVEQSWNGHAIRPPVGMRASQASHAWSCSQCHDEACPDLRLVPR